MILTRKIMFMGALFAFALPHFASADICGDVAGNLVVNCGFETGDFTGWVKSGNFDYTVVTNGSTEGFSAHSGSYQVLLGSRGSDGYLTQAIPTVAGGRYTISWYLGSPGDSPDDFSATWGGNTFFSQTDLPATPYTLYSFSELASSASTDLTFGFRDDPGYLVLDDVSVSQAAPEPDQWVILGTGIAGLMVFRKRRRLTRF